MLKVRSGRIGELGADATVACSRCNTTHHVQELVEFQRRTAKVPHDVFMLVSVCVCLCVCTHTQTHNNNPQDS